MLNKLNRYILSLFLVLTLCFCGVAPVNHDVPSPAITQEIETYNCFYAVVLHEAEAEPLKGKQAVAHVVINRLRAKGYPSSVCGVVTQSKQFSNISKTLRNPPSSLYNASKPSVNTQVARVAYEALQKVLVGSKTNMNALFYHADYVRPAWSKHKKLVAIIGKHKFYA